MIDSPELARRDFLRGRFGAARRTVFRPPWALAEEAFMARCTRCKECVRRCPEGILKVGDGGFPEVDFQVAACTFCGDCLAACASGALLGPMERAPWSLRAGVKANCLAHAGVSCQMCRDACLARAIRFPLAGPTPLPIIDLQRCTGCGGCVSACPEQAIELRAGDAP